MTATTDFSEALRVRGVRPEPSPAQMKPIRQYLPRENALGQYMGRITSRSPITETTPTVVGTMALMTGSTIRWEAPSDLVEIHAESFNAPQMVAAGSIKRDGTLSVISVRPVLAEEWADGIAQVIAARYDLPSDDPQTEQIRRQKIAELVLSMAVPLGLSPSEARRKARNRNNKTNAQQTQAVAEPGGVSPHEAPQPKYTQMAGRITSRARLTTLTKTTGTLQLASGSTRQWVASAAYVDLLEELFTGTPIVANMLDRADGFVVIQSIRPATREDWDTDEFDFTEHAGLGQNTVTHRRSMKKILAKANGLICTVCERKLGKYAQAAIAFDLVAPPVLMCRPCKENWKDATAAMSTPAVKAVA